MYSTHKEVKLLSRRLGMLHLTLYFFILAYVLVSLGGKGKFERW